MASLAGDLVAPLLPPALEPGGRAQMAPDGAEVVLAQVPPESLPPHWLVPENVPEASPRPPLEQPHKVALEFTSVSPHLDWLYWDPTAKLTAEFLQRVLMDRLVLLGELPDHLSHLLEQRGLLSPDQGDRLRSTVKAARLVLPREELGHPSRYLPRACFLDQTIDIGASHNARIAATRPPSWTWLELLAAGSLLTSAAVAIALEEIFLECSHIAATQLGTSPKFTFAQRCEVSGCRLLQPLVNLDETVDVSGSARWSEGPRKRMALVASELLKPPQPTEVPLLAWRFPGHLALERGLRLQAASIKGSWKTTRSGLLAWSHFLQSFSPTSRLEFPVVTSDLVTYSQFFSNGDTFSAYVSHLRFAARLHHRSDLVPGPQELSGLMRGLRKTTTHRAKPTLTQDQLRRLVSHLLGQGDVILARLCIIARCLFSRVQSELLPLRIGMGEYSGPGWHSKIVSLPGSVTISYERRKNSPEGAELTRQCSCKSSRTLCGVCALQAQIREHRAKGLGDSSPLFPVSASVGLKRIREACKTLGFPQISWHAFRRGAARDMLEKGCSLAQVLLAGGWRSSAFLKYLSRRDVDARMALELSFANSDSE